MTWSSLFIYTHKWWLFFFMSQDVVTLPSFYRSTFADQMYLSWRQSLQNSQKYFWIFSRKLMIWHLRFIQISIHFIYLFFFSLQKGPLHFSCLINLHYHVYNSRCVHFREESFCKVLIRFVALDMILPFLEKLLLWSFKTTVLIVFTFPCLENIILILKFPPLTNCSFSEYLCSSIGESFPISCVVNKY